MRKPSQKLNSTFHEVLSPPQPKRGPRKPLKPKALQPSIADKALQPVAAEGTSHHHRELVGAVNNAMWLYVRKAIAGLNFIAIEAILPPNIEQNVEALPRISGLGGVPSHFRGRAAPKMD